MRAFGARLMSCCQQGGIVSLRGNLGTGKTTLVRGALESIGVTSGVRSPTYTLIEFYPFDSLSIAHFDLYRLAEPEELEYLGFRDYLNPETLCFIEWPEQAEGFLDGVDLEIFLDYDPEGRRLKSVGCSDWGRGVVEALD
ncbi:MAG: tRNA (adenosine(37)-N6)-threonylcarbamoyltransferase complex ATPase subunit type 1 TsaE [Gammaproteobacteria bacterium]|nr:tRNA (adenosine(37)-N6)-threonylcarbamoyltransferase complex ATPase subunit type 1 TsaE [Gammaproteobacteria bacterium]